MCVLVSKITIFRINAYLVFCLVFMANIANLVFTLRIGVIIRRYLIDSSFDNFAVFLEIAFYRNFPSLTALGLVR